MPALAKRVAVTAKLVRLSSKTLFVSGPCVWPATSATLPITRMSFGMLASGVRATVAAPLGKLGSSTSTSCVARLPTISLPPGSTASAPGPRPASASGASVLKLPGAPSRRRRTTSSRSLVTYTVRVAPKSKATRRELRGTLTFAAIESVAASITVTNSAAALVTNAWRPSGPKATSTEWNGMSSASGPTGMRRRSVPVSASSTDSEPFSCATYSLVPSGVAAIESGVFAPEGGAASTRSATAFESRAPPGPPSTAAWT